MSIGDVLNSCQVQGNTIQFDTTGEESPFHLVAELRDKVAQWEKLVDAVLWLHCGLGKPADVEFVLQMASRYRKPSVARVAIPA